MADEKKLTKEEIKNEELTDEQANEASGGASYRVSQFTCQGGCGRTYYGTAPIVVKGRKFCGNCYKNYQKQGSAGRSGII